MFLNGFFAKLCVCAMPEAEEAGARLMLHNEKQQLHLCATCGRPSCSCVSRSESQSKAARSHLRQRLKPDKVGGHYGSGGADEIVFDIDNAVVGVVIGRGGENIQRIQRDFGISIQITKAQDLPPGSSTRPVTLKGDPSAIAAAKAEIDKMLDQRNAMGGAPGLITVGGGHYGSGGGPGAGAGPYGPSVTTISMAIPNDRVSCCCYHCCIIMHIVCTYLELCY